MKKLIISMLGLSMAAMMPLTAADGDKDTSEAVTYEVEMTGVV